MESTATIDHEIKTTERLLQVISEEQANRDIFLKILTFCEEERSAEAILKEIKAYVTHRVLMQPPQTLVARLVEMEGLESVIFKEDVCILKTSNAGRNVVKSLSATNTIGQLFHRQPEYREIYCSVLQACLEPKTKDDIETLLEKYPSLAQSGVYASYFIETLERTGGLKWEGKWLTTQHAREVAVLT